MTITLKIRRQDSPSDPASQRWELHRAPEDAITVADALTAIEGLAWDDRCTWPRCGVCTMVVEGIARPACGTRLTEVINRRGTVTLEPLSGFPLRRDLWVDRRRLRTETARLAPWPDVRGSAPPELIEPFHRCTRCGACLDACPEVRDTGSFVGAAGFGLSHPGRRLHPDDERRLAPLLDDGGIAQCGGARACVAVCPEAIPLDEALAEASAHASRRAWRWLTSRGRK